MEHIVKLRLAVLLLCVIGVERSLQIAIELSKTVIERRLISMEGEIDQFQTQNEKVVDCVTNIPSNTAQCARKNFMAGTSSCTYGHGVKFSAQVTKKPDNVAAEHVIVFDSADINEGECYSDLTGIFTCCKAGTYVFFWSITTSHNSTIAVNSVGEAENDSTGTMMVLLLLSEGAEVWIRMKSKNPSPSKPAVKRSSFTGYLIIG